MKSKTDVAKSFLTLVTAGNIPEAYETHVAAGFRHHNPYCKGDAKSLLAGMEENEEKYPNKWLKIHHTVEEGDMVTVHSHIVLKPKELELAVVHLLRFQGERIIEAWDVAQQIPADSPNENGMF